MIHLDSTFLVDLLRETNRGRPAAASRFLESLEAGEVLGVSVHVLCELMAGAELSEHAPREIDTIRRLTQGLDVTFPDDRFAPEYGKLLAMLQRKGRKIGTMDLLIATSAILADAKLVTRNAREFSRIPGLEVVKY